MKILFIVFSAFLIIGCGEKEKKDGVCGKRMEDVTKDKSMLVVGDSISIGYTVYLKNLFDDYSVVHNECNAMTSEHGAKNIDRWATHNERWNVCTINHGLWDVHPRKKIEIDLYIKNLSYEIDTLKKSCDKILFMTTTFINEDFNDERNNIDVDNYNDKALELMEEKSIQVCDLNFLSKTLGHRNIDGVHYSSAGYKELASYIEDCINN